MPIYQYKCKSIVKADNSKDPYMGGRDFTCGHEYTVFYTSVTKAEIEEADERCPICLGKEKERLISTGTSHILKGKWFKQGY